MLNRTEDVIRDEASRLMGLDDNEINVVQGSGQITTFNQLGFNERKSDKPDGWYLPKDIHKVAIIFETKSEKFDISVTSKSSNKFVEELIKNCKVVGTKYDHVIGILYNGIDVRVFKKDVKNPNKYDELSGISDKLENKKYYISLYTQNKIDKNQIYQLTKRINDSLHIKFSVKNLYHRMVFTACALVACRYGAMMQKGMEYSLFHSSILNTLNKSLEDSKKQNSKLDILIEQYSFIKMNITTNQEAIDEFIDCIQEISDCINSDYWNGEDVMSIFFNEFNRYKGKSEHGQIFTPDHITSLMYRIIEVNKDDFVFDGACGSGAFLVKAMCNMIAESGGINTDLAKSIKSSQLFGIEIDKEIYALACANMLIHKDGKTNLEQLDTRTDEAKNWIKQKKITKVLMNPPFERKYGCIKIVKNVLESVPKGTRCAFILPDKKLEKDDKANKILTSHSLEKIIKLPENIFDAGITTSIFVFKSGIPQGDKKIFTCYIEDDGFETVKNQGRHDVKNKWQQKEDFWVDVIYQQSGHDTCQWIKANEARSYQKPKPPFEIFEEDFTRTMLDYLLVKENIEIKEFESNLISKVLYNSKIKDNGNYISIKMDKSKNE